MTFMPMGFLLGALIYVLTNAAAAVRVLPRVVAPLRFAADTMSGRAGSVQGASFRGYPTAAAASALANHGPHVKLHALPQGFRDWYRVESALKEIYHSWPASTMLEQLESTVMRRPHAYSSEAVIAMLLEHLEASTPRPAKLDKGVLIGEWQLQYSTDIPGFVREQLTQNVEETIEGLSIVMSIADTGAIVVVATIKLDGGQNKVVSLHAAITHIEDTQYFVVEHQNGDSQVIEVAYASEGCLIFRKYSEDINRMGIPINSVVLSQGQTATSEVWSRIKQSSDLRSELGRSSLKRFGLKLVPFNHERKHLTFTGNRPRYDVRRTSPITAYSKKEKDKEEVKDADVLNNEKLSFSIEGEQLDMQIDDSAKQFPLTPLNSRKLLDTSYGLLSEGSLLERFKAARARLTALAKATGDEVSLSHHQSLLGSALDKSQVACVEAETEVALMEAKAHASALDTKCRERSQEVWPSKDLEKHAKEWENECTRLTDAKQKSERYATALAKFRDKLKTSYTAQEEAEKSLEALEQARATTRMAKLAVLKAIEEERKALQILLNRRKIEAAAKAEAKALRLEVDLLRQDLPKAPGKMLLEEIKKKSVP